jgi:hypothetical protein
MDAAIASRKCPMNRVRAAILCSSFRRSHRNAAFLPFPLIALPAPPPPATFSRAILPSAMLTERLPATSNQSPATLLAANPSPPATLKGIYHDQTQN